MANPVITFNSSTGSDTAASGAGPATAVTGTAAAHTNGSASTTITLTNTPNLSGVATDGSAVLWLKTASGRQFSKITAVDDGADTVTVEDSFNIAAVSAVNYAIGGKRATWDNADSRTLFATSTGTKDNWAIVTETDQNITSALTIPNVRTDVRGDSATTRRVISSNANAAIFSIASGNFVHVFENLKLQNTGGTKTNAHGFSTTGTTSTIQIVCRNMIIGDPTNTLQNGVNRGSSVSVAMLLYNCCVQSCAGIGVSNNGSAGRTALDNTIVRDCGGNGVASASGQPVSITGSLIVRNGGDGVSLTATVTGHFIAGNTIHGNTGDGIDRSASADVLRGACIINNNITANGGYGVNAAAESDLEVSIFNNNNYGTGGLANTSGARNNISAGAADLAVDPSYTSAAGDNFSVGTSVKAKGMPLGGTNVIGAGQSSTYSYVDIGASQREEPAGGGGLGISQGLHTIEAGVCA